MYESSLTYLDYSNILSIKILADGDILFSISRTTTYLIKLIITNKMELLSNNKNFIFASVGLITIAALRSYFKGPSTPYRKRMDGKVIIITGSSEGIGCRTAEQLLEDGAIVVYACRDEIKTMKIIKSLPEAYRDRAHFIKLDLSSFSSVKQFVKEFKTQFDKLDVLINNAGMWTDDNLRESEDGIEVTLQVNVLSHIVLTESLLSMLNKNKGRVINVSSALYKKWIKDAEFYNSIDVEDNSKERKDYKGYPRYSYTKVGNIYFTQYLAEYCNKKSYDVKTASLHPGVIVTELHREHLTLPVKIAKILAYPLIKFVTKTVDKGAQTTLHLCYLDDHKFSNGGFYGDCEEKMLLPHCQNKEARDAAMKLFKNYINIKGKSKGVSFDLNL